MRKLVNFRPVVFLCGGLIFGILFAYFSFLRDDLGKILTAFGGTSFLVVFVFFSATKLKPLFKILFVLAFLFFALFGGLSFQSAVKDYDNATVNGHNLNICGKISEITVYENYSDVIIDDVSVSGVLNGKTSYKIQAVIYGNIAVDLGDKVEFSGILTERSAFYDGNFIGSRVYEKIKYFIELSADEITVTGNSENLYETVHKYLRDALKRGMNDSDGTYTDEFAVSYAMLLGNSDYVSEETLSSFHSAGLAHVFAVSGLHIGVLAVAVFFVLKKLRVNDKIAFFIAFAVCLFYAGVCGFSASSLRAALMFAVLNIAKRFGFKYDGISSIFFAAVIILLISPAQLFCAGFQLSFAVVFTIIVLLNPMKRLFKKLPEKLGTALALSLSAEIGGLPVMLLNFGNFPMLSVFINILFIPLASVLFIILLILTILGGAFAPSVFLFLPKYIVFGLNTFLNFFDLKAFMIGGVSVGGFIVLYYLAVIVAGGLINLKKTVKTITVTLLSVAVAFGVTFSTVDKNNGIYAEASGSNTFSAVLFSHEKENLLVISDVKYIFSINSLKRAAAKTNGNVTVLLLSNGKGVDLQVVYTKLKNYFPVNEIYYAGKREESSEFVLNKEYKDLSVKNIGDGDGISFNGQKLLVFDNGRVFCGIVGNNTVAIFAPFGDNDDFPDISDAPNVIFCADRENSLDKKYSPEITVSLRYSSEYLNAEKENMILRLDKTIK